MSLPMPLATITRAGLMSPGDKVALATVAPQLGLPRPNTLVILGSSNAAGLGASTYAGDPSAANGWASPPTSWAGLLTAALGPGWTVFNRSISGTGAAQAVARFWTDVAPHRPSHVILATNPANDGFDPLVVLRNTEVLIGYCEMIGAVPILRGATGFNSYTAAQYASMLALNAQFDRLGRHRIDHFSTLDDGTGKYVGGGSFHVDGLHPNDAGYRHLFTAIDLGLFGQGPRARLPDPPQSGGWAVPASASGGGSGLLIGLSTGMPAAGLASFTLRARIRALAAGSATARAFLNAYLFGTGTAPLRLRNANGPFEVTDDRNATTVSTVDPTKDMAVHDMAFTFNAATGSVTAYADGAAYGSFTPASTPGACTDFAIGSRTDSTGTLAYGYAFSDVGLWAVPLQGSAIAEMAITNRMPPASRVFAASLLNTPNPGGQVANIVSNGLQPVIGSAPWTLVAPF